jgi:hypothetical protein
MSLFSYPIGRESPIYVQLTDTSYTPLVTAGENGATVVSLSVNEMAGGTPTIILDVTNAAGTIVVRRANLRPLTPRENWSAVSLSGTPIVLKPGFVLRGKASAGNVIDIDGVFIDPPQL